MPKQKHRLCGALAGLLTFGMLFAGAPVLADTANVTNAPSIAQQQNLQKNNAAPSQQNNQTNQNNNNNNQQNNNAPAAGQVEKTTRTQNNTTANQTQQNANQDANNLENVGEKEAADAQRIAGSGDSLTDIGNANGIPQKIKNLINWVGSNMISALMLFFLFGTDILILFTVIRLIFACIPSTKSKPLTWFLATIGIVAVRVLIFFLTNGSFDSMLYQLVTYLL